MLHCSKYWGFDGSFFNINCYRLERGAFTDHFKGKVEISWSWLSDTLLILMF